MSPIDNLDKPPRSRADTNRENAQKSTGPKTPEGKKRSSLNALRHGVTGQVTCLPTEDLEAFAKFTREMRESLNPVGPVETDLAQACAESRWQAHHARSWQRLALSERAALTIHLYPDTNRPELNSALAVANAAMRHSRELANLALYEQRYNRAAAQCLKELQTLQAARQKQERIAMEEAALLLQLHEKEQTDKAAEAEKANPSAGRPTSEPFNPFANGFVFSTGQIKLYIDRRARIRAARSLPEAAIAAA